MKIFIPFSIKDIGGTATFARKFSDKLVERGFEVSFRFTTDFDVLFAIADCPLQYALFAKITGKRIIQRLDGVYHRAAPAGRLYPLYNFKMKMLHNWLADSVVYQNEFSKLSCETMLGKSKKSYSMIYNGVDNGLFSEKTESPSPKTRLVTFAKFRRKDQIEPILEAASLLDPEKFSLDIYGAYTESVRSLFQKLPRNVDFKGKLSNDDLLKTIGRYDIFLFSDQSACPNSVIEAMAAGLAVVAYDRGSVGELVKDGYNGKVVPLERQDPFSNPYPFSENDYRIFARSVEDASANLLEYKDNSRKRAREKFDLDASMDQYINLIKHETAH